MKVVEKETETFCPANRAHWRAWLQEHHADQQSVWLVYHKKKSAIPTLTWSEAVDEALCFGWIDSLAKSIDDHTYRQFFSRRKPTSVWSKINKEKVKQLMDNGLMTPAGLTAIDIAKQNDSWTILDDVDALVIPPDLAAAFQENPNAERYFLDLSKSDKRVILQRLVMAKRPQTRQNRIRELVELAAQGLRQKIRP